MNLITIRLEDIYKLIFEINGPMLLLVIVIYIFYKSNIFGSFNKTMEICEAELGIGNNKIKIKPNYVDYQICYKIWVELSTRKIGLPIDYENDVIEDIYNSWYEFFGITRELIKEIPIQKYQNKQSTQQIVRLSIEVLNEGLRPHLTKWQAKYRKWISVQNDLFPNNTPQEIQKKYIYYNELVCDMKNVNEILIQYRDVVREISLGNKASKKPGT